MVLVTDCRGVIGLILMPTDQVFSLILYNLEESSV
jgi:hypothetical protein